MTHLSHDSLNKAFDDAISKLFENLLLNLTSPVFTSDKSTPIERFERGFNLALQAYDQALAVIEKAPTR